MLAVDPSDQVRLRHMLDAARKAVSFTQGRSASDLETDEMLSLALTRLLEILGEAAKNVSQGTKDNYPQIAWRQIAGTRDRLIHGYFDVDQDRVWAIVTQDLLPLIAVLEQIVLPGER
ncbi:MAG: DUF86 domain-containing protein [Anaerolineae bacterium]|nr:DUF86 domain-containing protein [Anaerolineae bacterium]